jgi:hypothetical protein
MSNDVRRKALGLQIAAQWPERIDIEIQNEPGHSLFKLVMLRVPDAMSRSLPAKTLKI